MSDTRWLTPLLDHTQIATTMAGAPAAVADGGGGDGGGGGD